VFFTDAVSALVQERGEELTVFPRHTKVIAICNNQTKYVLVVGLQGFVKKVVALGG
jgi:hypothetical protein